MVPPFKLGGTLGIPAVHGDYLHWLKNVRGRPNNDVRAEFQKAVGSLSLKRLWPILEFVPPMRKHHGEVWAMLLTLCEELFDKCPVGGVGGVTEVDEGNAGGGDVLSVVPGVDPVGERGGGDAKAVHLGEGNAMSFSWASDAKVSSMIRYLGVGLFQTLEVEIEGVIVAK